ARSEEALWSRLAITDLRSAAVRAAAAAERWLVCSFPCRFPIWVASDAYAERSRARACSALCLLAVSFRHSVANTAEPIPAPNSNADTTSTGVARAAGSRSRATHHRGT